MSMFRSAAEISSSDSESYSDGSDYDDEEHSAYETENGRQSSGGDKAKGQVPVVEDFKEEKNDNSTTQQDRPGINGLREVDTGSHTNMITAALLEFYCLSRAADLLNSQRGSHRRYTRDSPEVRYLGKTMYAYKSQFLSSHGLLARGVEREELRKSRQYYRDHLDLLGIAALEGLELDDVQECDPSVGMSGGLARTSRKPNGKQLLLDNKHIESARLKTGSWDLRRRPFDDSDIGSLEDIQLDMGNLPNSMPSFIPSSPVSYPLLNSHLPPPANRMSRYAVEFFEVKVLGRGSFGEVYHVKNHIDGQDYAIKKIPLSHRRLEQLRSGGQNQLEHIMREIRTLARLEHANIVRYYGAWVEQADHSLFDEQTHFETGHEQVRGSIVSHQDSMDEQDFGIVFEDSKSAITETHMDSASVEVSAKSSVKTRSSNSRSHKSENMQSQDYDEDVESIPRNLSAGSHSQMSTVSETEDDIFTDGLSRDESKLQVQRKHRQGVYAPAITLHIQMSLHPISLSSYLNPQPSSRPGDKNIPLRRHCFHLIPSLKLMLEIIYGVEYVHFRGIVHRDLKPANIFLSLPERKELEGCPVCRKEDFASSQYCHPRIGDFGLVADISHLNDDGATNDATHLDKRPRTNETVGTEFYSPFSKAVNKGQVSCKRGSVDEKVDIYALGVILFELIYRFDTKMERQLVLAGLTRHTSFPVDFTKKVDLGTMMLEGDTLVAESLVACIKGMLNIDPEQRWTCQVIKDNLRKILGAAERAYSQ